MAYRTRWCKERCLGDPRPRMLSERAVRRLLWLSTQVPPRVHTSNIRFHLNGFHTNSRYQIRTITPCYFCGRPVQDSIEHILVCSSIQRIFPEHWRGNMARCFFLAGPAEDDILLGAMLVYGIYAFHCYARHSPTPTHVESTAAVLRMVGEVAWSSRASTLLFKHQMSLAYSGICL